MLKRSPLPIGITTAIVAIFIGISSVSAQDLSGFSIQPTFKVVKVTGISTFLTCNYPKDFTSVKWILPKSRKLRPDQVTTSEGKSTLTLKDLSVSDSGDYKCRGRRLHSNGTSEDIIIKRPVYVYDPIKFVNTSTVQTFELGTNASVFCKAKGDPPAQYVWSRGSTTIDSKNSSDRLYVDSSNSLVIKNIQKSDETIYICGAREANQGQIIDEKIFVDVQIAPNGIKVSENVVGIKNNDVTLNCSGFAEPEPTYRWYRGNDGDASNITWITEGLKDNGTMLLIENVDESDEGNYTCVVSNVRGKDSATAVVVIHVPPKFTKLAGDQVKEGNRATIECIASGVPEPTVVIYRNGQRMNASSLSETTPVVPEYASNIAKVTFDPASNTDAGPYKCVATNSVGSAIGEVVLTVLYPPLNTTLPTVYACPDKKAVLSCKFDAYPAPDLQWGVMSKVPPPEGSLKDSYSQFVKPEMNMVIGFKPFNSTSNALVNVDGVLQYHISKVTNESYGMYYCKAKNNLGKNMAASVLVEADVPDAPIDVKLVNVTTRSAAISFSPPAIIHVTIDKYIVIIKNLDDGSKEKRRTRKTAAGKRGNIVGETLGFQAEGLQHDTNYEIIVSASNCIGKGHPSLPLKFNTHPIGKPDSVIIVKPRSAVQYSNYTIQWSTQGNGGGTLQKITINYKPVAVGNTSKDDVPPPVVIKNSDPQFKAQSYRFEKLEPSTKYEVTLTIANEVSSADTKFMFETSAGEIESEEQETSRYETTMTTYSWTGSTTGEIGSGEQETSRNETTVTTHSRTGSTSGISANKDMVSRSSAPPADGFVKKDNPQESFVNKDMVSRSSAPPADGFVKKDNPQESLVRATELVQKVNVDYKAETAKEAYFDTVMANRQADAMESAKPRNFPDFYTDVSSVLRGVLVPTELPPSTVEGSKISAGGVSPIMIGIIVAVVIILLIILDIICCSSRHCGLTHCIYMSCCAPASAGKEGIENAEEGSAEFRRGTEGQYRKDSKADEVATTVAIEKQPLADDAEPVANGTEQEMGVVNEQTPLHADQLNGDSALEQNPEKAPKKEEKELSPGDVTMEVSASEKEPLA